MRILGDPGILRFAGFSGVDLISACLYLAAAVILKVSSIDRATPRVHLSLAEADEKPVDLTRGRWVRCRSWGIRWWMLPPGYLCAGLARLGHLLERRRGEPYWLDAR